MICGRWDEGRENRAIRVVFGSEVKVNRGEHKTLGDIMIFRLLGMSIDSHVGLGVTIVTWCGVLWMCRLVL